MGSVLRLGTFALFLLCGSALHLIGSPRKRKAWISMLAIVMIAGYVALFFTAREAWPFIVSRQFADDSRRIPAAQRVPLFVLFSASGREWQVDPASWAPLGFDGLWRWLEDPEIPSEGRKDAARLLYEKAEPRTMPSRADERAVGLRIYWLHWRTGEVPPDAGASRRELLVEHRE